MAQKKKASAAARNTVASSTVSDGAPESQGAAEVCETGGGAQRRRYGSGAAKGNGSGRVDEAVNSERVQGECEKALVALRRGNNTKALRLIKEACLRHEASGVAHRVQGHIFMRLAAVIEDANAKQRHLAAALESARRAAALSPRSVEFAHFYAQLLLEAAKDRDGYAEVVRECERAFRIEQPVDPARESLHSDPLQPPELPTAEARVAHVHEELKALVQKANISSLSTWMKRLGTEEDKLRFVQMRKFADQDPMEHRVFQPKRANEVKKIVKTPEERRQEIEVRVAAAKLLQQRGALPEEDHDEKFLHTKLEKRKTNARNHKPLAVDRVREFWRSLSQEEREMKLVVGTPEFKEHSTSDALSEALEFAQERQTWRFWACCKCGERVLSFQELSQHFWEEHLERLPENLQQVVPQEISHEWAEQLLDEEYRPFDGVAAVRELVKSSEQEKEIPSQKLPLAEEDEARKTLLKKIYSLFRALIRSKYLAQDHVAIEEIQVLVPDPGVHYDFNQSPLYIRFLDPQPLLQIEKYLMELAQACGVSVLDAIDPPPAAAGEEEIIQDRLFLSEDFSQLLLDERVVKEKMQGEEERSPLALMIGKDALMTHMDLQLSWISGATEYEFPPLGWKQMREDQGQRGRDVFRVLETEFQQLYAFCDNKYEYVCYEEALSLVKRLCVGENRRRELLSDGSGKRFEAVLRDREHELLELLSREGISTAAQKVELDAITNVLRDAANAVMVQRQTYDGNLGVRVGDLDEAEYEARRTQDSLPRSDTRVVHAILRQKEYLSTELNRLDAMIMKARDDLQKLEIKLGQLAVFDYTAVVLPLVKSLLQRRLEGDTEKDALQKSAAASEGFLAELAKDQKSSGSKESENQKQGREKSKEKKKGKEFKDVKRVPSNSEQQSEAVSVEADEVDDTDNWDWPVEDDLQQQRDSEIHQTLIWEEERELLEALESQRRVEEEAKLRHLNEQVRKKQIAQQFTSELSEDRKFTSSPTSLTVDDVANLIILPTSFEQLSLVEKDGCQDSAEVTDKKSLPLVQTNDPLLAQIEDQTDCRCCEDISEQEMVKVSCQSTSEELGAGKDALLSGNVDHFKAVQRKTRGSGNRHRRKRGPRIYAEEGMIADRHAQPWKTPETANDPMTPSQQNTWKENGGLSTTDKLKPLSRPNGSRSFGAAPANGVPAAQPLLLLPAPPSHEGAGAHEGKKTLRQLQAEQDDEERFQAEMELAMRQSLDMLTPQPRTSIATGFSASSPSNVVSFNRPLRDQRAQQVVETGTAGSLSRAVEPPLKGVEEVGKGLRNEIGQYNCFLNVVIQSLWHLRRFREDLLATSSMQHAHVGNPCVVCALRDIFLGLDTPVNNRSTRDAVAPTALRVALSALYSDSDFFQEAQMNDASEVLAVIFECLHKGFVLKSSSDGDSVSSMAGGSWDCQGPRPCIAHALFGLDIAEQMNCQYCGLESRHLKYTTFFHNINASALRTAKVLYQESSMDKLLKLVDINHQLACDTDIGGCGRHNHTHHLLHAAPSLFTMVLGWQNGRESFEDISATVDAMDVSLDVGVIYRGLDEGFQHRLVSVVCYYGQHYHCFTYNQELGRWVMFDDSTVKVIGEWRDVASTCRRGHLQPQVLFYEAA